MKSWIESLKQLKKSLETEMLQVDLSINYNHNESLKTKAWHQYS